MSIIIDWISNYSLFSNKVNDAAIINEKLQHQVKGNLGENVWKQFWIKNGNQKYFYLRKANEHPKWEQILQCLKNTEKPSDNIILRPDWMHLDLYVTNNGYTWPTSYTIQCETKIFSFIDESCLPMIKKLFQKLTHH